MSDPYDWAKSVLDEASSTASAEYEGTTSPQFRPSPMTVQVNFLRDQITYNPPAVKSVFGRGDWPHQNIVLVRYTSIFEILETRMRSAYHTWGTHLAMIKYFGDAEAVHQAEAEHAAAMKEWNRWWRRLARLPHRIHEWYGDRTWRQYEWHVSPWYVRLRMIVMGKRQRRWRL